MVTPINATHGTTTVHSATITDDDPPPVLSIADAVAVLEGNSGTTNASFTVTLTGSTSQTVTVDYATADGTATVADGDYTSTSGTLTFNPGDPLTQQVTVAVVGDTKYELDETFVVNLSNPGNATVSDAQGQGTITDDDDPPSLSMADASPVADGDNTSTSGTLTSMQGNSPIPVPPITVEIVGVL